MRHSPEACDEVGRFSIEAPAVSPLQAWEDRGGKRPLDVGPTGPTSTVE
jgi:hypothetical protein